MKNSSLALLYILIIPLSCFLLGALTANSSFGVNFQYRDYLPAAATLFSAFGGSYFAYMLENKRIDRNEDGRLIDSVNITILNYTNALNTLLNYKKQCITPYIELPAPHLEIPPSVDLQADTLSVNTGDFSSLFNKQDVLDLISEIHLDMSGFENLLSAINQRSEFHKKQYQPIQERLTGVKNEEEAIEAIGKPVWFTLKQTTDSIIKLTDEMIDNLESNAENTHQTMRKYVNEPNKIIRFQRAGEDN